jgi:hypothetical protein
MHDVQPEPQYDQEVPKCKPHDNERMFTTNARRSKNVNEKDSENAKNVRIVSVRRNGISCSGSTKPSIIIFPTCMRRLS